MRRAGVARKPRAVFSCGRQHWVFTRAKMDKNEWTGIIQRYDTNKSLVYLTLP
jgi:hypothetical protein